ncbi:CAP domain-containing protein [Thelonectria olida]|uniref:CAP domain-containing protein n=1 Tax=Thelonectria olida TaxID=1576542 RepID=A0A9P8WB73_9HYPO|nr:CAP domain-containing protein [Thelonectria olida]
MLFSTFYGPLLLVAMQTVVLGDPIPIYNRDVHHPQARSSETTDVTIIKGGPALYPRHMGSIEYDHDLDVRGIDAAHPLIFSRALSPDHQEALRLHNAARAKKKLKPLVWDSKLWQDAKVWAKHMAKTGTFAHSPSKDRPNQGENLAYAYSSGKISNPITLSTKAWLNEAKYYHGEVIPKGNFSDYGHYTQCMWNGTTKVGFSSAQSKKGAWYTVARYSAPGNVVGKKPYK